MTHFDLWLRADTLGVSSGELVVLRYLATTAVRGTADVRVDAAAPIVGMSLSGINKHLRGLIDRGYVLRIRSRRGAHTTYRLDIKQMLERAVAAKTMTSAQAQEAYGSMMVGPDRVCPAPAPKVQHPQAALAPKAQP